MSVGVAGATITEVAHRHDVTRQQIYTWRGELKKKGLLSASANALFIPVEMNSVQTDVPEDRESCSGMIELRLSCGRTLRFGIAVDPVALAQLIRAVEAA
jgi:transposase